MSEEHNNEVTGKEIPGGAARASVAQIIQRIAVGRPDPGYISTCEDLKTELAMDSFALLELVVELEACFGVNIDIESLDGDDLKTVDNIVRLIDRLKK